MIHLSLKTYILKDNTFKVLYMEFHINLTYSTNFYVTYTLVNEISLLTQWVHTLLVERTAAFHITGTF